MHITSDVLPLHRAAVVASVDAVDAVKPSDLAKPTPCAGWSVADLIAHMTVQNRGFAAAARGRGSEAALWEPASVSESVVADPATVYAASAADVLEAFAADGVLDATFTLPDFGPDANFPGAMAIGFHFVDYVVHTWDVARAVGATFELPDDVIAAALPLVLAVPDGEFRAVDGSPFQPAVSTNAEVSDMDRILAHLGRSPAWTPC
jgi:uncharacterized protein (TIGR03086 family)